MIPGVEVSVGWAGASAVSVRGSPSPLVVMETWPWVSSAVATITTVWASEHANRTRVDAVPLAGDAEAGLLARANVDLTEERDVGPGHIDYILPWAVHAEVNGDASTAALILRSQRSGTFVQNIFDAASGAVEQYHGPRQISYALG